MKKLILSVIAVAYFAGFSVASLAGDMRNRIIDDGMAGKIEAHTNAEKAKNDKNDGMKEQMMVAEGKVPTDAMQTNSLHRLQETRLHYSPPCPPPAPIAGMDACRANHG